MRMELCFQGINKDNTLKLKKEKYTVGVGDGSAVKNTCCSREHACPVPSSYMVAHKHL